jgi:hypothetical protein
VDYHVVYQCGFILRLFENPQDERYSKYKLRSMPGDFTGLHLVSFLYVGFEQITPGHDVGFDLSKEYETALQMYSKKRGQ